MSISNQGSYPGEFFDTVSFEEEGDELTTPKVHFKHFTGPCDTRSKKRLLNMGTGIEQRPWTPTVRRGKIAAELPSPGPASVKLPAYLGPKVVDSRKNSGPAFSFGGKYRKDFKTVGPGPAQYDVSGLGHKGKITPIAASLQSRYREKTKFRTPAPGEYDVAYASKFLIDSTPKYTFGQKPKPKRLLPSPAPNAYKIPNVMGSSKEGKIRSAPAFSLVGRNAFLSHGLFVLPGPGAYNAEYTATKSKPPMFTMRSKYNYPKDDVKPGPGAHCPEKFTKHKIGPSHSISIKYSPYLYDRKAFLIPEKFERNYEAFRCLI